MSMHLRSDVQIDLKLLKRFKKISNNIRLTLQGEMSCSRQDRLLLHDGFSFSPIRRRKKSYNLSRLLWLSPILFFFNSTFAISWIWLQLCRIWLPRLLCGLLMTIQMSLEKDDVIRCYIHLVWSTSFLLSYNKAISRKLSILLARTFNSLLEYCLSLECIIRAWGKATPLRQTRLFSYQVSSQRRNESFFGLGYTK